MKAPGEILVLFLYTGVRNFLKITLGGARRSPHSAFRCPTSTVSSDTYICS